MSQTAEDVRDNIVKVTDDKGKFYGTGFLIEIKELRYCITCHHCICKLKEIYIERDNVKCSTEWIEEFSDMGKDIAVLKVIGCSNIKPLKYAKEAMPQLPVSLWGYSDIELETFPQGALAKKGSLSDAPILFHWSEEKGSSDQKWNKKPEVNVYVFQYDGKFHLGNSGAITANNSVIGIFTAKDDNYGWVIPIQTILEKFEDEKKLAKPSASMVDVLSYLEKAYESYNKGDFNEGLRHLDVILKDRNFIVTLYDKGVLLGELGKHEEAIVWFNRVLDIDPNHINALNAKGNSLNSLGRYKEAIKYYDKALAIDPNANLWGNKGRSLNSLGKHKEAIECFDKALKLNPNSVTDWIDKGAAFVELGKYDEAIDFLDKALSIDPNNVDTLSHKGASLANSEKYEEAIEYFDKALAIDPNNAEVSKSKEIALNKLKEKEQI